MLARTAIVLDDAGAPTPGAWSYAYVSNGVANPLVPDGTVWALLRLDAALTALLVDGAPVDPRIVAAFAEGGLALTAGTDVRQEPGPSWTLSDPAAQRVFTVVPVDGEAAVLDGGQSFQLRNYAFWTIRYYAAFERWMIVDESGLVHSFGGSDGAGGSLGNSVEWSVRWARASGAPLWSGPSTVTAGQQRYARAWNLASTTNLWSDRVSYGYNEAPGGATGRLAGVEQPVGPGGLSYTKACYLTSVTDVFGRRASLRYALKLWDASAPEAPREYADPHKPVPDDAPNAFQDRYETYYLAALQVTSAAGTPILGIAFEYAPRPTLDGPASAVANVTPYAGRLLGDTFKRFLTGISQTNADGDSLPALRFGYWLDAAEAGASPGALTTITYPQGAVASYGYTRQVLPICDRGQNVPAPEPGATPGVWFGPDYAVTTWIGSSGESLFLTVYTWLGGWVAWHATPGNGVIWDGGVSELDVITQPDGFGLTLQAGVNAVAYVFRREVGRLGQWTLAGAAGAEPDGAGPLQPTLSYQTQAGGAFFAAGESFLLAGVIAQTPGQQSYDRLTWRWPERAWSRERFAVDDALVFAASHETYVSFDPLSGTATLFHLDTGLEWQAGEPVTLADWVPQPPDRIALVSGTAMLLLSVVENPAADPVAYTVQLLRWDGDYAMDTPVSFSFRDPRGASSPEWVARQVGPGLVAVGPHLIRFDGRHWLQNDALYQPDPDRTAEQRFAYGPDYAIRVVARENGADAAVLVFDPNVDCGAWSRQPVVPAQALPGIGPFAGFANWPSAGGADLLAIGQYLYDRGVSTDWSAALGAAPLADMQSLIGKALGGGNIWLDTSSLVNAAPDFIAAYARSDSDDAAAGVFLPSNGSLAGPDGEVPGPPTILPGKLIRAGASPGPGKAPGGPGVFAAYDADAAHFEQAACVYLQRYAGHAVDGALVHYAASSMTVADGLGNIAPHAFLADPEGAGCDPTGTVVKYYRSISVPGSADPSAPTYGSAVQHYVNGRQVETGLDYYDMLDGLLLRTDILDAEGQLVSATASGWQVFRDRADDPADGNAPPEHLYGGFVCRTGQSRTTDGVTATTGFGYVPPGLAAPFSGQLVTVTRATHGGDGAAETFTDAHLYAYDVDPACLALNLLNAPAQSVQSWSREGGAATAIKASAIARRRWRNPAGAMIPAEEATFEWAGGVAAAFPFAGYVPGQSVPGWACHARTIARARSGLVVETMDASSVAHSTLYADGRYPVAGFVNASLSAGACAYAGFEEYEDAGAFARAGGATIRVGDAHAGLCSLDLVPGGTLSARVTPANVTQTYLLGYWLKTPAGFAPNEASGWSIGIEVDGGAAATSFVPFASTSGEWRFVTVPVPLTAGTSSLALQLTAANAGAVGVLLDDVFVAPLLGGTVMQVFDSLLEVSICTMRADGQTLRRFHDRFGRVVANAGPQEQATEVSQRFLSRAGSAADTFLPGSPNLELTLHAADGGCVERFADGESWTARWTASNAGSHWTRASGTLAHSMAVPDTLSWNGWPDPSPETAAFLFELWPTAGLGGPFGLAFGSGCAITFTPGSGYAFTQDGVTVQAPLGTPPASAMQWLLVLARGAVLFFADGQMIFSATIEYGGTGSFAITTGPSALTLRNLAALATPRIGLSYHDGAGRAVQVQQLTGGSGGTGSDSDLLQQIYDAANRRIATTRAAPGSFGSGASLPLLAYRPGFVEVAAFLDATGGSWEMTGDVADYYRGQADGPVPRSDDQGYPYHATRFAAAPLRRPLERGAPGKPASIHDVDVTSPAERATTQYAYAANAGGGTPDLPAGRYALRTVTSPAKAGSETVTDTLGRRVATTLLDDRGEMQAITAVTAGFGPSGNGHGTTSLPNALLPGPQSQDGCYAIAVTQDPLDRVTARTDPDTGTTRSLHDAAGRLRFTRRALAEGETGYQYTRYDAIGRVLEQGTVQLPWDPAQLASVVSQAGWPDSSVPHTASRSYAYDGDGSVPAAIGHRTEIVTTTAGPAGPIVVTERFAYHASGRVATATLCVSGQDPATIGYAYNALNEVVSISYPSGAPLPAAFYGFDEHGRIARIGTEGPGSANIAAYTYTPDGDIETESRNRSSLVTTRRYASPGWLLQQTVTASGVAAPLLTLASSYDAQGRPVTREVAYALPGFATTQASIFSRDGQGRLTEATVSGGAPGNEAITSYDPSGNIWTATLDGARWSFVCAPGSDRIASGSGPDGPLAFGYAADGWMTADRDLTLAHDPALNLTSSVEVTGASPQTVAFAYGGGGGRVLKTTTGGTAAGAVLSVRGTGHAPLAWRTDSGWTAAIPGPNGALAAIVADQRYFPIEDPQRTLLAVLDAGNGLDAAHLYAPFGTLLQSAGPAAAPLQPRFLGQALDAETGLYDFAARLYDPVLRRFCSPDAARQYASPYLFTGNDPLSFVDPSGHLSIWARIGIGIEMTELAILGIALSVVTAGASDALSVAANSLVEAGEEMQELDGGEDLVEQGEETEEEAEQRRTMRERSRPPASQASIARLSRIASCVRMLGGAASGATTGGAQAGLQYDIQHGRDFTAAGFFATLGANAAADLITGGLTAGATAWVTGFAGKGAYPLNLLMQTASGAGGGSFAQLLQNAMTHQPLGQGVAAAASGGALQSFAQSLVPSFPSRSGGVPVPSGARTLGPSLFATAGVGIYNAVPFMQSAIARAVQSSRRHEAATAVLTGPAALLQGVGPVRPVGPAGPQR
ncbi:MAG: RHS repeat-associated core domain-containing protein [Acetobacteraceae bacterium]|nr:RHS repeat-associated core domain-containing protein [Acetobacteraceae bacterium]